MHGIETIRTMNAREQKAAQRKQAVEDAVALVQGIANRRLDLLQIVACADDIAARLKWE